MASMGNLDTNAYCLTHMDLAPRNILVDTSSSVTTYVFTGILEWDSAIIAPFFMSCSPPMWLWAWNDDDDEDERLAAHEPSTADMREVKRIFEGTAGSIYSKYAYQNCFTLARKLFGFGIHGFQPNENFHSAEEMLAGWAVEQAVFMDGKS